MTPADWALLVPAVLALLGAITAHLRQSGTQQRVSSLERAAGIGRHAGDQSCSQKEG